MKNNPLTTILFVILALVVADLAFNDGRALASITSGDEITAVIDTQGQNLQNNIAAPSTATPPTAAPLIAQPEPGLDEPAIHDLVPTPPDTEESNQPPEAIINWSEELARPTATHRALTDEQLLACVRAQEDGRRLAPYCPTNAAELLGEGR